MSKLISVWGAPDSGKTAFAVKLACTVYAQYNCTVLVVLADDSTPMLPVLFPHRCADDLYSIGVPLSKTEITQESLIASIVTCKDKKNFGFLGYRDGDNRYTYPSPDEAKYRELLDAARTLADVVIVDCQSSMDLFSKTAVRQSDTVFRLAAPDLKSISYWRSQLPLYADPPFQCESHIVGINNKEAEAYMPVEDVKAHFGTVSFVLPYCRELRQQYIDGELTKPVRDKKYAAKLKAIAGKIV